MCIGTLAKMCASKLLFTLDTANNFQSYYPVTQAKGQVANNGKDASVDTICKGTEVQSLCCAPGTTLGTCGWEGYNGVGMPCSASCANDSAIAIAENSECSSPKPACNLVLTITSQPLLQVLFTSEAQYTNANIIHSDDSISTLEDQTCNGGYQAYCCVGFKASQSANTASLALDDQVTSSKRSLQKRGISPTVGRVCLSVAEIAVTEIAAAAAAFFSFGVSEVVEAALVAANVICW